MSGSVGGNEAGIANATLANRIALVRASVQKAQEACKHLQGCDLDLQAQKNLLTAVGTTCIAKRQLLCDLKRELQELTSQTDPYSMCCPSRHMNEAQQVPYSSVLRIYCGTDVSFTGFFCTLDPASGNVVLCSKPDDTAAGSETITVVSGWSITKVEVVEDIKCPQSLRDRLEQVFAQNRLSNASMAANDGCADAGSPSSGPSPLTRREAIVAHFANASIPVEIRDEDECISIYSGLVVIQPPYLPSCCRSTNAIVLKRVQDMLNALQIS
ncbi:unnamed protein product [Schistocephalus solidus]|uniref:AD domain-containing protein n=1 Tax=Schistocephalus solidus TaxID=70667 RepID=A0A3P7CHP6_SCHSO|nr:unnamed protein product [Schistocephalus solidus]